MYEKKHIIAANEQFSGGNMKKTLTIITVAVIAMAALIPIDIAAEYNAAFAAPEASATPSRTQTKSPEPDNSPNATGNPGTTESPAAAETDTPKATGSPDATESPDVGDDTTPEPTSDYPVGDFPPYNEDPEHYRLDVDLTNCVVTVYERDDEGMYTKVVRQMIMTSGNEENRTPSGTFSIGHMKERFGHFIAFQGDYAQYWTQVVNGVYFHSILYASTNESTMKSASYNNLGRNVSHGCIRMYVEDARWIYYNIPAGTICHLSNRKRNAELTKSLKKTIPFGQYQPTPDPNPYPDPEYTYCNANAVPMSTGFFGINDSYNGTVDRGARVEVLQRGKDYLKIRLESGREGYVYARFFQDEEPGPIEIRDGEKGVAHLRTATRLYKEPGGETFEYNARKNTDYDILEIKDEHFRIKLGDVEGWIAISQADFRAWPEDTEFIVVSKIRASKLSLLPSPEKGGEAIEMLDFGDEGRVFAYGPEWSLIRCRGKFGYVQSGYISVEFQPITNDEQEQLDDVTPSEVDPSLDPENKQATPSPSDDADTGGDENEPDEATSASPSPSNSPEASASGAPSV